MKLSYGLLGIAAALLAGAVLAAGQALAQMPPLEIPFVKEWAGSPHARVTEEPFNHWNEEGEVPIACARCHSTPGYLDYIGADGSAAGVVDKPAAVGTVIGCVACHNKVTLEMTKVAFPSGAVVEKLAPADARCITCHQGRESTDSVNKVLTGKADDAVDPKLGFINVHYRAAGATRFGGEARGGYQYAGKQYKGYFTHTEDSQKCADCHEQHTVKVRVEECAACHKAEKIKLTKDLRTIRKSKEDFDGDGNVQKGIAEEIANLHGTLMKAIQAYAEQVSGEKIIYAEKNHPYFFVDKNGNGKADVDEAVAPNQFKKWTPRLLRAAYNYQFVLKDPGVYAHNPHYVIQLMYDSLEDLGKKVPVTMASMVRPKS